jgi:3'(2'), 5'-bisphosphate nucleotidase
VKDKQQLLRLALRAAIEAGREVLNVYAREFSVEEKEDRSPLTEADTRSHDKIEAILKAGSPGIPILSEEGATIPYEERKNWQLFWMIDPLDGTKEFVKKNGEFTVNIALMAATHHGAVPVAGVVYAPYLEELFVGSRELGAYRARCAASERCPELEDLPEAGEKLPAPAAGRPYTIVASRSHMSPETQAFVDARRAEHPDLDLVSAGSSLKLCRVADGSADEYPRFAPTMEWDTAAGDAVARAAGCEVLRWGAEDGAPQGPLTYNKPDLHNPWFLVRATGLS